MKKCRRCQKWDILEEFTKDDRYPDGRTRLCKRCSANRIKEWRHKKRFEQQFGKWFSMERMPVDGS